MMTMERAGNWDGWICSTCGAAITARGMLVPGAAHACPAVSADCQERSADTARRVDANPIVQFLVSKKAAT